MPKNELELPEFERYAPAYGELLRDPIRNRFASDPLHFHRRKWLLIQRLLKRQGVAPNTLRWLDVGCGRGELLAMGAASFASAAGCDPAPNMLRPSPSFSTLVQPSPVELPLENDSVDFVTAVCVYHHVHGEARALLTAEVKRVLSPGGLCCIVEHNPWNPVTRAIVRRCPVDVDAQLQSAREARTLVADSGFQFLSLDYFLYLPESQFFRLGILEKLVSKLPFGGQYALLAQSPLQ